MLPAEIVEFRNGGLNSRKSKIGECEFCVASKCHSSIGNACRRWMWRICAKEKPAGRAIEMHNFPTDFSLFFGDHAVVFLSIRERPIWSVLWLWESFCSNLAIMTHQGYMAISPPLYQHIQTVETTPMIITEASGQSNKYLFDGSVCGSSETDETVFHDNAVFVARKFGCCCCSTSESSVVKRKDISSADITTKNPFGSVFLAWILLGCFGHHRLCAGRPISAIIMFLGFTLGIAFTAAGFAQAETSAPCGVLHSTGYCTTTNDGWLAVGIVASVVLALSILWWISDVFLLRRWTQYVSFSFVPIFSPICSYLSLTLSN